ncbi:hypothetical protein DMUE_1370, partial [Dictyocoela muelleri]
MAYGEFNWTKKIDNIVFNYNNTKHTATRCKPFVLYKRFDFDQMSSNVYNQDNSIANIQSHIYEYVDTYKREYNIRQYGNINVGSIVLLARLYNINRVRRNHVLDSLYFPS